MTRGLALVWCLAAAGCKTADVVVPPAPECTVPPALLQACATPAALEDGLTYGELMKRQRLDRENLARCASQMREVDAALQRCRGEIEQYNARIGAARATVAPK